MFLILAIVYRRIVADVAFVSLTEGRTARDLPKQQRAKKTDSLPTPLGVNHTAGSPTADSYSQDNSKSPGRNLATVSPTEPWSNIQNVPEDNDTASRQMPLLQRTCDKQTALLPSRVLLKKV